MKMKLLQPENKEVQTELTVEEKEKVYTVLSALLGCIGSAVLLLGSFIEKESKLSVIVSAVGYGIVLVSWWSYKHLILEEDRFSLFKKYLQCFPDRVQNILFSHFPYGSLVHFLTCMPVTVLAWNGTSLIPSVLALIFNLFLAGFAIVWGYRDTRETTKDVQLD